MDVLSVVENEINRLFTFVRFDAKNGQETIFLVVDSILYNLIRFCSHRFASNLQMQ